MSPSAIPTNSGGSIPHRNIDSGSVGKYSSIAIDSNGNKHISYRNHGNGTLSYATDASGSWVSTTVDSTLGSGWFSSIALDSNDSVHIAHYDNLGSDLEYTTNKSGSWVTTSLDSSHILGWTPSIVIDSNDNVHIVYLWMTWNFKLRYATDASGSWAYTDLSPTTGPTMAAFQTEADISLALDSNDNLYAAYTCGASVSSRNVCVATNASGTWTTSDITSSSQSGFYPSLSIDSSDYLHISYYEGANDDLKYSTNASGSWVHTTIDQTGDVGLDSSMYLDTDDAPYIVYYDKTNGNLKYATNRTGSWNITTIDSIGDVGYYPSIVVESNDRSHISYYDETNGALKYAVVDDNGVYGWSINSTLPDGLEFNENTGIISGTPTQLMSTTQYTIQARNSGGVSTATISISVNDVAPGPFEYIPENNTITNNSLVHLTPYFIDTTSGNGSTWQVATLSSPGANFELVVNDIIYFDANQNKRLYAFNPQNDTAWRVNSSLTAVGQYMAYAIDDVLYFSAFGAGLGNEFWAYNTTNDTVWQVADINAGSSSSKPGYWLDEQSGELIFFRAETSSCSCWRLHVFNASNQTVWEVTHSFSAQFGYSGSSKLLSKAIGDTLYFAAKDASSHHFQQHGLDDC